MKTGTPAHPRYTPVRALLAALLVATSLLVPAVAAAGKVIVVPDVGALYRHVNDATNAGALLVLTSPTPYRLSRQSLNGGRLELQKDMSLLGLGATTIIDASQLLPDDYTVSGNFKSGAVRLGRGSNSLTNLTVRNAANGPSAITTDLVDAPSGRIQITGVVASNSQRGLDIRNINVASRMLDVSIANSYFVDNAQGPGLGLRIANISAPNSTIRVSMAASHANGNVVGCLAANLNTSNSTIAITSSADTFDGNGNGCAFIAGLRQAGGEVRGNSITVDAYASRFSDNTDDPPATFPERGGIIAVGGQNVDAISPASNNSLRINLYAVTMGNNGGSDLKAWGAFSPAAQPAGTYNSVVVRLIGTTARSPQSTPSDPPEPAGLGTNTAAISP